MKNLKKIKYISTFFFKPRKCYDLAREALKNFRYSKNKKYIFFQKYTITEDFQMSFTQ